MGAPTPVVIPAAFANAAPGGNINYPIPDSPPGSPANLASWNNGFPADTMEPVGSGGLPPFGQDFNGVLYSITQHILALEMGQPYGFSAALAADYGGYAAGAVVGMAAGNGLWLTTVNGNTVNPDTAGLLTGWVPLFSFGAAIINTTGGTTTLSLVQSAAPILRIQGELTSNALIIVDATVQQWLISNETTGAHTVTIQTADSGASAVIPQSGASGPTGVYCADRTNLYIAYSIGAAYAPINSPVFTGTPTGPTAALGNSSAQLATTAFVNRGSLLANNGFRKNPDGSITQWGRVSYTGGPSSVTVVFPTAFTTACYNVVCSVSKSGYNAGAGIGTTAGVVLDTAALVGTAMTIQWRAEGK
jgi:hypothetical protein